MSIRTLSDIKLPIGKDEKELFLLAQKKLDKKPQYFEIKKKTLDARDKNNIRFVYTIAFSAEKENMVTPVLEVLPERKRPKERVVVAGSGPAGLFCALRLLQRGITPIVVERGAPVDERAKKIDAFSKTGVLDTQTNVQFGEGGAGTFSDGKLNTQTHSPLNAEVLKTFVSFGAPAEIAWLNKPHIGSDYLKTVVKNMREYILEKGGEVRFHTRLEDICIKDGKLCSVTLLDKDGGREVMPVSALVLAIGHSARDTFEMLLSRGVTISQKEFSVGVRIEHLQADIGFAQYGKAYTLLPPADYKLVSHASERSAFTFCMCPGGFVMPATSEEGMVVTNGMSNYARNERNANSALLVQVKKEDFRSDHPLAGVEYQRRLERNAYVAGGGNYRAPVQLVGDFLRDRASAGFGEILPTYAVGTAFADLRAVLPSVITTAMKTAILDMDKRLRGFARPDAILTGVETRTSSPVRLDRGEDMQAVGVAGLYPCGEGAGYAGGITSSAVDGLRVADAIYKTFC